MALCRWAREAPTPRNPGPTRGSSLAGANNPVHGQTREPSLATSPPTINGFDGTQETRTTSLPDDHEPTLAIAAGSAPQDVAVRSDMVTTASDTRASDTTMLPSLQAIPTEFSDGVVRIRRIRGDDAEEIWKAAQASVKEVGAWLMWCREDTTLEFQRAWVEDRIRDWDEGNFFGCVVERIEDGRYLGNVGLSQIEHGELRANLGYWIRTGETGKGYCSRAARLMVEVAREHLGLARVEVIMATANVGSQRVAENVGATREGLLRRRIMIHGRLHDAFLYAVTSEESCVVIPRWIQERSAS